MSIIVNQVEHDAISKGMKGAAIGAAAAGVTGLSAGVAAVKKKSKVPPQSSTPVTPSAIAPTAPVAKSQGDGMSAFGVEGISKAKAWTEKGRRYKAEDAENRKDVSPKEARRAAFGGAIYTAKKAPKGKKLDSAKTHVKYMHRGTKHKTQAGAYGKAKNEHFGKAAEELLYKAKTRTGATAEGAAIGAAAPAAGIGAAGLAMTRGKGISAGSLKAAPKALRSVARTNPGLGAAGLVGGGLVGALRHKNKNS